MTALHGSSRSARAPSAGPLASRLARFVAWWWRRSHPRRWPSALVLPRGAASSVDVGVAPLALVCDRGLVWVTHDAVPGDHVLSPGQRFIASRPGRLVLYAIETSGVVLGEGGAARDVRR